MPHMKLSDFVEATARELDEYIITSGEFKGHRGFFTRDTRGAVVGVDLGGRFFSRVPIVSR